MEKENQNDWLESLLQEKEPEIKDNGFTRRVMASMPAPAKHTRIRTGIVLVATLLASLLVFFLLPAGDFLIQALQKAFQGTSMATISISSLAIVVCMVWGAISAATAEA